MKRYFISGLLLFLFSFSQAQYAYFEVTFLEYNNAEAIGTIIPTVKIVKYGSDSVNFDCVLTMNISDSYSSVATVSGMLEGDDRIAEFSPWLPSLGKYDITVTFFDYETGELAMKTIVNKTVIIKENKKQVYAYNAYQSSSGFEEGVVSFTLDSPESLNTISEQSTQRFISAGAWANGMWYGTVDNTFISIHPQTGERTFIGNMITTVPGISYDYTTDVMYAVGSNSTLYKINLLTGTMQPVAVLNTWFINLACSPNGVLYAIDTSTDKLCTIDKSNGNITEIGYIGFDAHYAQDMEFDLETGYCYYAAYNVSDKGGELRYVDISTGETFRIGKFTGGIEITGLAIPNNFSTNANFVAYNLPFTITSSEIDYANRKVILETYQNTNLTNLPATFILSNGATATINGVAQISGVSIVNLSNPITYTITSADGNTTKQWTVEVSTTFSTLVTNGNDTGNGSLRKAITYAQEGETITFLPEVSVINLTSSELSISNKTIHINGGNGVSITRIDGVNFRIMGIYNNSNYCSINNLSISGGYVVGSIGGGIYIDVTGKAEFTNCNIFNNHTGTIGYRGADGGGIHNNGLIVLNSCAIYNNSTANGGNTTNGYQGGDGGGIFNMGEAMLINCTISNNNTGNGGNGQRGYTGISTCTTYFSNCLMGGNGGNGGNGGKGGGIYNGNTLNIVNSTIANNNTGTGGTAGSGGSGGWCPPRYVYPFFYPGCNGATGFPGFSGSAGKGGGIYSISNCYIQNSIVAKNCYAISSNNDIYGEINSGGFNLISLTTDVTINGTTDNNLLNTNPLLETLANNGGATLTCAIPVNSLAVNAIPAGTQNTPTFDQRGFPRVGNADIGAYEYTNMVTQIAVSGEGGANSISTNAGTLQMYADILPVDATNKTVTWSVINGTATAKISSNGLLSATGLANGNGTVTVKAKANDGSNVEGTLLITISNQVQTDISNLNITNIQIFPNPTDGKLNIDFGGYAQDFVKLEIFNSEGKLVITKSFSDVTHLISIELNESIGLYYLRLTTESSLIIRKFVLK